MTAASAASTVAPATPASPQRGRNRALSTTVVAASIAEMAIIQRVRFCRRNTWSPKWARRFRIAPASVESGRMASVTSWNGAAIKRCTISVLSMNMPARLGARIATRSALLAASWRMAAWLPSCSMLFTASGNAAAVTSMAATAAARWPRP